MCRRERIKAKERREGRADSWPIVRLVGRIG